MTQPVVVDTSPTKWTNTADRARFLGYIALALLALSMVLTGVVNRDTRARLRLAESRLESARAEVTSLRRRVAAAELETAHFYRWHVVSDDVTAAALEGERLARAVCWGLVDLGARLDSRCHLPGRGPCPPPVSLVCAPLPSPLSRP